MILEFQINLKIIYNLFSFNKKEINKNNINILWINYIKKIKLCKVKINIILFNSNISINRFENSVKPECKIKINRKHRKTLKKFEYT